MKNIVKISAAGSGKTWDICHDALTTATNSGARTVIITYTNRGAESIKREISKQNFGVLHPRIQVKTWYRFLLSDLIKPYQSFITNGAINKVKSVDYSNAYGKINYQPYGTWGRYFTHGYNLHSNQVAELVVYLNEVSEGRVIHRLEEVYENIYFDEVQDLAGYDIDILRLLMDSCIGITCCGDNKQATFSTHNTRKNKKQTGKNIWNFFDRLSNIEIQKNLASRRFNSQICSFANAVFPVGDPITTIMTEETDHDGVFLISPDSVDVYCDEFNPQALRYDAKTKAEGFNCVNFGACKGETFDRTLIFPNRPLNDFILNGKPLASPEKYYVGVTRTRHSIAIVMNKIPDQIASYEKTSIITTKGEIKAMKYIDKE